MRTFLRLILGMPILLALLACSAYAQGGVVYVATYIELMPNALGSGAVLLKRYRNASRKEAGNLRVDVLAEIARDNRFVIISVWSDKAAFDAHVQSAAGMQFREKFKAIEDAPADERANRQLYLNRGANDHRSGTIYVVTHVDVIPPGTDTCMAALRTMSADTAKDAGNISYYNALQQLDHANHFTVVEEWTSRKATTNHAMAAHTRAFRDKLKPIAGALCDERFYMALE